MDRVSQPKRKRAQPRKLNNDSLTSIFRKYARRNLYAGSVKFANVIVLQNSSLLAASSVLASIRAVELSQYTRDCLLYSDDDLLGTVTDALIAALFQLKLINPRRLTVERGGEELLRTIDCTGLAELRCGPDGALYGSQLARIANRSAPTLKHLTSFPAEAVHLLNDSFDLETLQLSGAIPDGSEKLLPKTVTYKDFAGLFPDRLGLINAVELDVGELSDFELIAKRNFSQVSPNARIRRLVIANGTMFGGGWKKKMLRHLRLVFPNWNSLRVTMEIQSDDHGYDTYFRDVMNRWSDKFEAYLRQESHPLAIEVEASLDLEAGDDRIRARHYPKFVCTVVHGDFEEHGVGTKFLFVRTEDFGEERSLNMKCAIYVEGDEELGGEDDQREEQRGKGLGLSRYW